MEQAPNIWARKGESVVCVNGHHVCDIAHDIYVGDGRSDTDFTNWTQPEPARSANVGTIVCTQCRGRWLNRRSDGVYIFHFADGWR